MVLADSVSTEVRGHCCDRLVEEVVLGEILLVCAAEAALQALDCLSGPHFNCSLFHLLLLQFVSVCEQQLSSRTL